MPEQRHAVGIGLFADDDIVGRAVFCFTAFKVTFHHKCWCLIFTTIILKLKSPAKPGFSLLVKRVELLGGVVTHKVSFVTPQIADGEICVL